MAFNSFLPTKENFLLLRTRLNKFLDEDMPFWGAGKLLAEVNAHRNMGKKYPERYRTSLNKFRNNEQNKIDIEVARSLWSYFITLYPDETLNSQGVYIDIGTHRMSHILRHFFEVDKQKSAEIYAPNLAGDYILVRQHWTLDNQVAIGRLRITMVPESDGHVIEVEEWVSGRPQRVKLEPGQQDPELEHSTGYAFPKGPNIFVFLKTQSAQPKIITIESVIPEPQRRAPFRVLEGSIYAGIGRGPHWAKRFVAHRINPARNLEICTKKVDSAIIDEFGHYGHWWLKEDNGKTE